jgi:hypothetical protein
MMIADNLGTRQLYEDAEYLHQIRHNPPVQRDRFINYWLDRDYFK